MSGRKTRKKPRGVSVSWLNFAPAVVFLLLGVVGLVYVHRTKPVAALGLITCGRVAAVTVIMSDGKMLRYTAPDKDGLALIERVPKKNFSSYEINGAMCSPPKVY